MSETSRRAHAPYAGERASAGGAPRLTVRAADTEHDTILRRFLARAESMPNAIALRTLASGGAAADAELTWGEWRDQASAVAGALVAANVATGDRVAVLAGNSTLWPIADLGILMAGAIGVGVFPTTTAAQCAELLRDSGARVLIVDSAAHLEKLGASRDTALFVVCADEEPANAGGAIAWERWLASGADALERADATAEVARRTRAARPEDIAGLIYTSGSTGEPKGACVSHAYLLRSAESIVESLGLTDSDRSLSVLPFAHAAERVFGLYTRIVAGMEAGLVADAQRTWPAARAFSPTLFGGLPRFFEKAYTALREARDASDGDVRAAWTRLESVGARRAAMRRAGEAVPSEMEAEWQGAHAPAAAVLASLFGGRLRLATSGGAPLPIEVATSLDTLGLTVLGAYGQTEHLCVAFHRPNDYAFDSVGRPMPGTELQIADDGEVLVRRGALTFSGYWNKPAATREAFTEDGAWLRTGDLGSLDAAGRLVITGRKKEILALSTGKKVAPLPIEARLVAHPSVAHAVVVGEGQRFVGALLFLRPDVASDEASLDVHVADLNAALAPHEQVRRWRAVPHELSEAAGELTPTLKAKRAVIAARYADLIESLYA